MHPHIGMSTGLLRSRGLGMCWAQADVSPEAQVPDIHDGDTLPA